MKVLSSSLSMYLPLTYLEIVNWILVVRMKERQAETLSELSKVTKGSKRASLNNKIYIQEM